MTNKRILTLITLLLFLFLLVGCDWITPNQPPVITSDPVETATVGVDYTYNVVAIDPNAGDVLTYSLTTEPEGMLIDEDSGVITWKADDITAIGVGDYDVVVVVSDDEGLSDSQDFTITVSEFVVELVGIEVDPKEMTLLQNMIGTFKVTANYNDGTTPDVTADCDYASSDNIIATVEAGKIKAVAEGTVAISAFYKGKTDTIDVTVTYLPMELIVDMPLFEVGTTSNFTIKVVANSDLDKTVKFYFKLPDELDHGIDCIVEILYLDSWWDLESEAVIYDEITGEYALGGALGDPLINETRIFKGTFNEIGTYSTMVEVWTVSGDPVVKDVLLCSKVITADVE